MNVLELKSNIVETVYGEDDPSVLELFWADLKRIRRKKEAEKNWWPALSANQLNQLEQGWWTLLKQNLRPSLQLGNQSVSTFLKQLGVQDTDLKSFRQEISEAEFLQKVSAEMARKALRDSHEAVRKAGFTMTMEEINAEIAEARAEMRHAENHS